MPTATLAEFAGVNDAAAATGSKLRKQAVLAEYFRGLDDTDLRLAVRFAAGRTFPATQERVLNVGGAIVSGVVLEILGIDPREFHDLVVRSGELGEALAMVWPARVGATLASPLADGQRTPQASSLRLEEVADAFDDLSRTGIAENKREILRGLFRRCTLPREATYLTKIIFGDMRTGVQEGALQAGVAEAFGKKLAEVQRCQLLAGDLEEVAILARYDKLASATFRLFHPIQFMLAAPQDTAEIAVRTMAGRTFYAEDKLDGIRAQVHKSGERIAIYTRTMDRADGSFPDVVGAIAALPGEFLLDGEIVPWRNGQILPFAHIQRRLGRKVLTPRILRENPALFIAFDILFKDGQLLMDESLRKRREALTALCSGQTCIDPDRDADNPRPIAPPLLLITDMATVASAEQIERAFEMARSRRNEGIVLKDPESIYSSGRRGQMWLKLKTHLPTFDCVITAAEYGHGKRRSVLSDYTFAFWDREPTCAGATLVNIGKAYSGLTDEEIAQMTELLLKLSRAQYGRVHAVEPSIVLEIACDQIQRSTRHASGYALRFPRIKHVRWDKRPQDADRLARIVEIYQNPANTARRSGPDLPAGPTLFDKLG